MFYHVTFLFDYEGFSQEARIFGELVEKGNYFELNNRVSRIVQDSLEKEDFFTRTAFGVPLSKIKPLSNEDQYLSSKIGMRFYIILSQYLKYMKPQIGNNWGFLLSLLENAQWPRIDIDTFLFGHPIGTLVSEQAKNASQIDVVNHEDPYWRWIRPLNSYKQGGWINHQECIQLHEGLIDLERDLSLFVDEQEVERYKGIILLAEKELVEAINQGKGLYTLILWEDYESDEDS